MAMTTAQSSAYQAAVGYTPAASATSIAAMIAVALFLWAAWVVLFRMQSWRQGSTSGDLNDLVWSIVRASGLLLLVFWFIR